MPIILKTYNIHQNQVLISLIIIKLEFHYLFIYYLTISKNNFANYGLIFKYVLNFLNKFFFIFF